MEAPGKVSIVRKPSDGSGAEETLLTQGPEISASSVVDWSPDGRYLSFDAFDINQGRRAQWILPLFGDRKPFQYALVVGGNVRWKFFAGRPLVSLLSAGFQSHHTSIRTL